MAIVAEHSIGRVWQEEGERNGDTSESRRGTDPALLSRFRMIYPTGPLQHVPIASKALRKPLTMSGWYTTRTTFRIGKRS
uniref:Uncharacterized protein n=1 Tax=Heterorhabditis bacteriophora TaxID=37862 RepID=A0A1I7X2S2_HETBA